MDSIAGKRIKNLREKLNITQQELAVDISRGLISRIENGKAELTWSVAIKVVNNFKAIAKKKNIKLNITAGYLMEDPEDQLERVTDNYLEELTILKNNKDYNKEAYEKVIKIEKYFMNNKIPVKKKYKFYEIIIDISYNVYKLGEAKIQVLKALEIVNKIEIETKTKRDDLYLKLYAELNKVYYRLKDYKEMLFLKRYVESLFFKNNKNNDNLKTIYCNTAAACSEIEEYQEAIKILEEVEANFIVSEFEKLVIMTSYAYCNLKQKKYSEAEKLYFQILESAINAKNKIIIAHAYASLAKLYYELNRSDDAYKYINLAINIDEIKHVEDIIALIYQYNFLITCKFNFSFESIKETFEKAIGDSSVLKKEHLQLEIINEMYKYCSDNNCDEYILYLLDLIENRVTSNVLNDTKISNIFIKACNYFRQINKNNEADKIFNRCVNIINIQEK